MVQENQTSQTFIKPSFSSFGTYLLLPMQNGVMRSKVMVRCFEFLLPLTRCPLPAILFDSFYCLPIHGYCYELNRIATSYLKRKNKINLVYHKCLNLFKKESSYHEMGEQKANNSRTKELY